MTPDKCPICDSSVTPMINANAGLELYFCPQCGMYQYFPNDSGVNSGNRHLIAGYLFETRKEAELQRIDMRQICGEKVKNLLSSPIIPKTSMQYLDKILLHIYKLENGFSCQLLMANFHPAIGYAKNREEFSLMIHSLMDMGYMKYQSVDGGDLAYYLTIEGLQYTESLLASNKNSTTAFIAMRFTNEMRVVRDEAIKPAALTCGFDAFTVDEEEYLGDVTDRIITGIKTCRFVIADFTDNNLGVYYEAGYAKGLGIPVIKTCRKDWHDDPTIDVITKKKKNQLHFDIEHDNLILWESQEDLARKLEAKIRATIL